MHNTQDGQGVYALEHLPTGSIYIGSTTSFRQRQYQHRSKLNTGNHHRGELQQLWDQDGDTAFRFTILDVIMNADDLLDAEREWIKYYMDQGVSVHNVVWGNGSSPEVVERRAAGHRGLTPAPDLVQRRANGIARTWHGFVAPDGTVYRNIHNLAAFCREHGLTLSHMIKVYRGRRNQHHGWTIIKERSDV